MRHGPAAQSSPDGTDRTRPLTDKGRDQTAAAMRGLRRLGVQPVAIFSSPLLRATQTAEIVAHELSAELTIADDLAAGATPDAIIRAAKKPKGDILLVGHDPDFSAAVSYLLTGDTRTAIDFARSGVVAIEFEAAPRRAGGTLLWYLRRGQLALLGEAPASG